MSDVFPPFQGSDPPAQTSSQPAENTERPKRGPRKGSKQNRKPRVTAANVTTGATATITVDPTNKIDLILQWFDVLIGLDPASRKVVLEKLLA